MKTVKGHERGMPTTTDDSHELSVCELRSGGVQMEKGCKRGCKHVRM